ncbi:MAG TPA: SBBP repeat-containing protein [Solirubrobacterales bacterium]|nr:SBBP repeat-containing protein [Solirubrobacterales bacterium]
MPAVAIRPLFNPRIGAILALTALALLLLGSGNLRPSPVPDEPSVPSSAAILSAPLAFEPDAGRFGGGVDFVSHSVAGGTLYLSSGDAILSVPAGDRTRSLRFDPIGASPSPRAVGLGELPGKANSFIGADRSAWRSGIPTYARVRYRSMYPGIDLDFYGNQRQLEYDWRLAAGADPGRIAVALRGADSARIGAGGALVLGLGAAKVRQAAPVAYQWIDGERRSVPAAFTLRGDRLGFELGRYDRSRPLVIDPILSYSTYLGGALDDFGADVAVDPEGGVYVAGLTFSADFPAIDKAFPDQALTDGFVTKFEPDDDGQMQIAYSTYIGASLDDSGVAVAVDSDGAAYITGRTTSTNFPTVDPLAGPAGGDLASSDLYVAKLSPDDGGEVALDYSTYVSGGISEFAAGIDVDAQGAAYVIGSTDSTDFPLQDQLLTDQPGNDVVVFKINPHSSGPVTLAYSTYLGGNGAQEAGSDIAVDEQGAAYITGRTDSTNFPQQDLLQGDQPGMDVYVTKLDPDDGGAVSLAYSTYLGGSESDFGSGIAVDQVGAAYVVGGTASTNFPTSGASQGDQPGQDGFVTKLAPDTGGATTFGYSTYLGGAAEDTVAAVDVVGDAYVTGTTLSTDFPTAGAIQGVVGGREAFVSQLRQPTPGAQVQLPFSTYFGGSGDDEGSAIAVGPGAATFLAGSTRSDNLTLLREFQGNQGLYDAFAAKLEEPVVAEDPEAKPPVVVPPSGALDTRITKRPTKVVKTKGKRARVTFRFTASRPGASFECAVDDKRFSRCSSPLTIKVPAQEKTRRHRFRVRAVDAAGNPDSTPALARFRVRRDVP